MLELDWEGIANLLDRWPEGMENDDRAKAAGFTKLKRLGKGEYERQY